MLARALTIGTNQNRIRIAVAIVNFSRRNLAGLQVSVAAVSRQREAGVKSESPAAGIGTMPVPMPKSLAQWPAFRHSLGRPLIPNGRCSQGGVKFPTGGKGLNSLNQERPKPASAFFLKHVARRRRVSRFGAT